MVGNVRKVNAGLIFLWRQHRLGSGQEGTGCALTSIPTAQCSCHHHRHCLSFQPVHSSSLGGGWDRAIPDVPPITHVLCHLRKLEEKLARVPRLGLSFLPWGSQPGTPWVWGMREPPPTWRLSLVGTDRQVLINELPRMCITLNGHSRQGVCAACLMHFILSGSQVTMILFN